ncbi:hypothetical protein SDC9_108429 [bioreactor metagenome]|uniref:Uncharacterized protein n=1 Tax=bioreactor metagenome TaxID=1076179 RepID=A0A645B7W9_9ZZZZ
MHGFMVLALARAALAHAGAQLAHGRCMHAVARQARRRHAAHLGAIHVQRHAAQHMLGVHIAQTGCGTETAKLRTARTGRNALPIAGFGQRGGCVKHVTPLHKGWLPSMNDGASADHERHPRRSRIYRHEMPDPQVGRGSNPFMTESVAAKSSSDFFAQ